MSNVTAIQPHQGQALAAADAQTWTPDQIALIKRTVAPDASDDELKMFLHVAAKAGLDPLQRQVYFIKRRSKKKDRDGNEVIVNGKQVWEEKVTIQAGVDGLQARALRMPDCEGIRSAPVFAKDDFVIDRKTGEIIKHESNPFTAGDAVGAWAIVERAGKKPFSVVVRIAEYRDTSPMWKNKPSVMIDKVARSTALRRAYPENFGGIYDPAEMGREAMVEPAPEEPSATPPPAALPEPVTVAAVEVKAEPPPPPAKKGPPSYVVALWNKLKAAQGGNSTLAQAELKKAAEAIFGDTPKPSNEWTADECNRVEAAIWPGDVPF